MKPKYYKNSPRHKFWKDSTGVLVGIEYLGGGVNYMRAVVDGKADGCFLVGVVVGGDWQKITESEFEKSYKIAKK